MLSFCLVDGFLTVQGLLVWCGFICLFVCLIPLPEKTNPKNLVRVMSKSLLPIFSFRRFMVLGLTFKYLIHFAFVFVYGVRKWPSVIFLHAFVQFPKPPLYILDSFVIDHWLWRHGFISGLSVLFIVLCVCFYASSMLFWLL